MKCSKCGKELPEDAHFCNMCGCRVERIEEDSFLRNTSSQESHENNITQENTPSPENVSPQVAKGTSKIQKKKDRTAIYALLIFCAIILCIKGFTAYLNNQNEAAIEKYARKKYGDGLPSTSSTISNSNNVTTPDSYENEEERWDAENCIYSNFKYGVAFTLPNNMAWHKVSGTAKHTVVKFVQPDTQLTLFVNINPINGSSNITDIWDVYEEYTNTVLQLVKNTVNRNSAEQIKDHNFQKAEFCGRHAIKTCYTSILGDDRHDEKIRLITIDYTFIYNNSTTTVTVKCYDEIMNLYKKQGISMEDFLKSFQLTPIS